MLECLRRCKASFHITGEVFLDLFHKTWAKHVGAANDKHPVFVHPLGHFSYTFASSYAFQFLLMREEIGHGLVAAKGLHAHVALETPDNVLCFVVLRDHTLDHVLRNEKAMLERTCAKAQMPIIAFVMIGVHGNIRAVVSSDFYGPCDLVLGQTQYFQRIEFA